MQTVDGLKALADFLGQLITISGALLAFTTTFASALLPKDGEGQSKGYGLMYAGWLALGGTILIGLGARYLIALEIGNEPVGDVGYLTVVAAFAGVLFIVGLGLAFLASQFGFVQPTARGMLSRSSRAQTGHSDPR